MDKVFTSHQGNNNVLVEEIAKLYLKDGDHVADVTYGRGVFWYNIDTSKLKFTPSDIITRPDAPFDFTNLPYPDVSFDTVVFDPPYIASPGSKFFNDCYQNHETTKSHDYRGIMEMYWKGMVEAHRVLRKRGYLWVKCKDTLNGGIQKWSHIEIYNMAMEMGYRSKDLFILTPKSPPPPISGVQRHARKNHSYMWIFQKK